MLTKKLKELIARGETDFVELKKSTGQLFGVMETICAFLNGDGGVVLIGVTDDGKIIGQEVTDKTKRAIANELEKISPYADVKIDYISLTGERYIIVITVNKGSNKPYM